MVLRQLGKGSILYYYEHRSIRWVSYLHVNLFPDPAEKEEKVRESVEKAKEAVALDVKDGTSWSKLFSVSGSNGW